MRRGAVRNPNVVGETKERRVRTKTSCFPPLLVKRGPMKSFGRKKKEARDAWVVVSLWNEECFSCCCRGFILENASPPPLSAAFTGMCPWLTASSLAYIKISKKKKTRATYIQPEISRHILATSRWPRCARIFRTRKKNLKTIEYRTTTRKASSCFLTFLFFFCFEKE